MWLANATLPHRDSCRARLGFAPVAKFHLVSFTAWEEPPPPPPRGGASASGSQSTCIHSLGCRRRPCCCSRVGVPVGLCCKTAMAHLTPSEVRDDERGRRGWCWRGMGALRHSNVSSRLSQGRRQHNANATKHLWYSRTRQGQCSTIQLLRRTLKGFGAGWRLSRCAHGRRRFARTCIDQGQTSKPCGKDSSVQVTGERDIRVRALGSSCLRVPVCWDPRCFKVHHRRRPYKVYHLSKRFD